MGLREGLLGALSVSRESEGIRRITLIKDVYSPTDNDSAEDYALDYELDWRCKLNGDMIDLILVY